MDSGTILQAIDGVQTTAVSATLTGLSLTAASFLTALKKEPGEKLKELQEIKERSEKALRDADTKDKEARNDNLQVDTEKYNKQKSIVDSITGSIKSLIGAFVFFSFDLIKSLSLDPIVEEKIFHDITKTGEEILLFGKNYDDLLVFDVGSSITFFSLGIIFLWVGAKKIFSLA